MTQTYSGSCLCGTVRYEFDGEPRVTVACHCSQCRKATGSAFAVWALIPSDQFRFVAGSDAIREHHSSDHGRRMFCRNCGGTLGNLTSRRQHLMHLAAGTLDRAPQLRIAFHTYTASKADWFEITDGAPQHPELPPQRPAS